ncbi:MAG: hypothetical protein IPL59_09845 [Candidatus Competibacteraceae bacterium]|nr:hypothetical protein [Candidatus Competibacteraceae bacterium]MBK8752567.1 hypothetical protein [Candidatus Competibacteraceae bacterium]
MNTSANVGKATLAMLAPSEDNNMDNERLARDPRTEGVNSALPATIASRSAMLGFIINSFFGDSPNGAVRNALYSLI